MSINPNAVAEEVFTIGGITIRTSPGSRRIFWASDWAEIPALRASGQLEIQPGPAGTYGHDDYIVSAAVIPDSRPTNADLLADLR